MTASTLDASMIRLESIKENKHLYNKSKIAEAEALAGEALRMANEAKLAAARLEEVKKTLSMFSKKLERVEKTVQKEVKPKSIVIKPTVKKEPVVLAAEALHMANEARLAAARLNEAKKTLSIFSTKQTKKIERTVQKEVKPKTIVTEPIVKKEPVVVDEPVREESAKEEAVTEGKDGFETPVVESTKKEIIEKESTKEEIATVETHVEESAKEETIEEESSKEEKVTVVTPVEESAREEPIEEEAPEVVEQVKEELAGVEEESKPSSIDDTPVVDKQRQADIVSQNFFGNGVVKVIETGRVVKVIATGKTKVTEPENVVKVAEPENVVNVTEPEKLVDVTKIEKLVDVTETEKLVNVTENVRQEASCGALSQNVVGNGVVRVTETGRQKNVRDGPNVVVDDKIAQDVSPAKESDAPRAALVSVVIPPVELVDEDYDKDIIEDFLDSLGVDEICGVDDNTLGFIDRPDSPVQPPPFVKHSHFETKTPLTPRDVLHSTSWKEQIANTKRKERNFRPQTYQRTPVNNDFADPFGVDHDDLVFCGKLADLCEPPDLDDEYYVVLEQYAVRPEFKKKTVSFKSE